ncbi:hypothetical protein MD537_19320, partial [Flavihumibacter sediminis]|nr:hypothetical protein [Flavihumibacter sediminis]
MTIQTKPTILKICLLFMWMLYSSSAALLAQQKPGWDTIKTSEVRFFKSIQVETGLYVDNQGNPEKEAVNSLPDLQPVGSNFTKRIPSSFVGKPVYLQFTLKNDL